MFTIDAYQNYLFPWKDLYFSNVGRPTLMLFYCFIVLDTAYREIKRLFPSEWKRAVSDLLLFIIITVNL